jgi:hypothetical protein
VLGVWLVVVSNNGVIVGTSLAQCGRPNFSLTVSTHDNSLLASDPIKLPHDAFSAAKRQVAAAPTELAQCVVVVDGITGGITG